MELYKISAYKNNKLDHVRYFHLPSSGEIQLKICRENLIQEGYAVNEQKFILDTNDSNNFARWLEEHDNNLLEAEKGI